MGLTRDDGDLMSKKWSLLTAADKSKKYCFKKDCGNVWIGTWVILCSAQHTIAFRCSIVHINHWSLPIQQPSFCICTYYLLDNFSSAQHHTLTYLSISITNYKAAKKIVNDLRPLQQNVRLHKWQISANLLYSSINIQIAFVVKQKIFISQQKRIYNSACFPAWCIHTNKLIRKRWSFLCLRVFCSLCSLLFCLT